MKKLATSVTVELTARDVNVLRVVLGMASLNLDVTSQLIESVRLLEILFTELSSNMVVGVTE